MGAARFVQGRQSRHDVEFLQELPDDLVAVLVHAEGVETRQDALQRMFDVVNGLFREVLPVSFETPLMPQELLTIELGAGKACGVPGFGSEPAEGRT